MAFSLFLSFSLLFSLFSLSSSSSSSRLYWRKESTFSSVSLSQYALNGRGDTLLIQTLPNTEQVKIYSQNERNGVKRLTLRQTLLSPLISTVDNFGCSVELEGDEITGNILMIGGNGIGSTKKYNGAVFYYSGDNSKWSCQQIILANEMMNEPWTYFGVAIDLDSVTDRTLIIGCTNCTKKSTKVNDGMIYVYHPTTSPEVHAWTQQQVLTSRNLYNIGAKDVEIYRNTLIGVGYTTPALHTFTKNKGIIFQLNHATGLWSETQTLTPKSDTVTDTDIFEDTIVMSSMDYTYQGNANFGAVLIFYPNTPPYHPFSDSGPDALPPVTQWSQQQTIYTSKSLNPGLYFGSNVKISGNSLVITELGTGDVYILERESHSGFWSQQSVIMSLAVSSSLTIALKGSDLIASDGTTALVYAENLIYNCLIISLEDQFGDGWDIAKLLVESPLHGLESFSPDCDTENPLEIRYCPVDVTDDGHYTFKIINGDKAIFHWEILWRVYEERTGQWHVGNWDTEMEFDWHEREEGFHNAKILRPLPTNITCVHCPTNSSLTKDDDPHPDLKLNAVAQPRILKESHHETIAPTYSPAPTLAEVYFQDWREFVLEDSADLSWFHSNHKSTSYYLSDIHGHHLVTVGTMCTDRIARCWLNLPEGEYLLRIGGALDLHKSTHFWRYCNIKHPLTPQTQIEFIIKEQKCHITSFYTRQNFCSSVRKYDVVLKVIFMVDLLTDRSKPNSFSPTLSSEDITTFQGVLSEILSEYSIHSIQLKGLYANVLAVDIALSPSEDLFSSEEVFHDSVVALKEDILNEINEHADSHLLPLLTSGTSKNSYLHHITKIAVDSIEFDGIWSESIANNGYRDDDIIQTEMTNEESPVSSRKTHSQPYLLIVSAFGFFMMFVFVLGIVGIGLSAKRKLITDEENQISYEPLDTTLKDLDPPPQKNPKNKKSKSKIESPNEISRNNPDCESKFHPKGKIIVKKNQSNPVKHKSQLK